MRIEQLEYFIQISQFKSLTRASEELHLSHQALNASIQKMEEELGFQLLTRSSKGISLTQEGKQFAKGTNKLLAEYYTLLSKIRGEQFQHKDQIRIGIYYGLLEAYFSDILAQFYKECPFVPISVTELSSDKLTHDLNNHMIDFGIVSYNSNESPFWIEDPQYSFVPIYNSKLYARVSIHSPLSKYESLSLKTLFKENILIYQPKGWGNNVNPACSLIEQTCPTCQVEIETNYQLHKQKLIQGLGVAFGVPTTYESPEIKLIAIKENIHFISGILSLNENRAPALQYTMNYLTLLCSNV